MLYTGRIMKIGKHNLTLNWGDIVISKNKSFEYQIEFGSEFATQPFELSLTRRSKYHAGTEFIFSIYKLFWISLQTYDHRHL